MKLNKWIILLLLSVIWGSSFILIKKSLQGVSALELGALRIIFAATILLLTGWRDLRGLSRTEYKWLAVTGLVGTFIPVFLFAVAQMHISSSMAALLNSLTPLHTLVIASILYKRQFGVYQIWGLILGLMGSVILVLASGGGLQGEWYWSLPIIVATVCYGLNANFLKQHLSHLNPLTVTKANFALIVLPAIVVLLFTDFGWDSSNSLQMQSLGYIFILALFGTALAKVMFNKLIQISSAVFGSLVTYTMPVMALMWGYLDGEHISAYQLLGGVVVIVGVYLTGKYARSKRVLPRNQ